MKIIDAHLHLFRNDTDRAELMAQRVGHHNSIDHLREVYEELGMVHGVVMGNGGLETERHQYPADLFHYCVGLDSSLMQQGDIPDMAAKIERHLQRESCCGVKLYPGYNKIALTDPLYEPVYQLAARYDKPVAVHMGLTSFARAHLKYCHPMALDEVAADHPDTTFVMCHFGNPFFETSAAVLEKNPNVVTDLSGLIDGRIDFERYFTETGTYAEMLRGWLAAICSWDRILYGTDWPIVNLGEYIEYIKRLVPEKHWEAVFFENANRVYKLGL
ncbi:MAG: amidohydrolase family protein [Clostridia bacterium]|nr:amidohydrolase family protein [Clostridia bacterium]